MGERLSILILDDHRMVAEGLAALVAGQEDMEVMGIGHSVAQGLDMIRSNKPDVALVDCDLNDGTAADLILQTKALGIDLKVVVLSDSDGFCSIRSAVEAGARAFLLKRMPMTVVVEAVRSAHAGRRYLPPEVASRMAEAMSLEPLTAREKEVLGLLAEGRSNQDIADRLGIGVGTVKIHVNNVLSKLDADSRTEAVIRASLYGLVGIRDTLDDASADQPMR
ncbi:MAG: response regulator transcription factor [Myxococcota bacterium]